MAPGSPELFHPSPTKRSSQELPLVPVFAWAGDTASPAGPGRHANGAGGSAARDAGTTGPGLVAISEAGAAADLTPSLIADAMDVDNGTTAANEAAAAEAAAAAAAAAATGGGPASAGAAQPPRALRSLVRTPEPQTALPQRQAPANGNGTSNGAGAYGNGHHHHNPSASPRHQRGASQARDARDTRDTREASPSTPGQIPPFDWDEFEARYEHALSGLNGEEKELLEEFDRLVNYFNVWATAASAHDDERAVKRLQTRERYVKIAEQSLGQRKQHLTEVVRAFQSALALLSQP